MKNEDGKQRRYREVGRRMCTEEYKAELGLARAWKGGIEKRV